MKVKKEDSNHLGLQMYCKYIDENRDEACLVTDFLLTDKKGD